MQNKDMRLLYEDGQQRDVSFAIHLFPAMRQSTWHPTAMLIFRVFVFVCAHRGMHTYTQNATVSLVHIIFVFMLGS